MKAGTLNTRVSLQKRGGKDALGGVSTAWTEYARPWANVTFLSGLESATAGVEVSQARGSIRMRYREDVAATHRAAVGRLVFDIVAVMPSVATREYVDLVVTAGANNGG